MNGVMRPYDLPDSALLEDRFSLYRALVWQPTQTIVVIGRSNRPETSLHPDALQADGVTATQRPSGGEAVLLSPRTLVVSAMFHTDKIIASKIVFPWFNGRIITALETLGVQDLGLAGISDITLGPQKLAGTALYRSSERMLYHAVINVAEDTGLFTRYLRHPQREPEYRAGRDHVSFVTSLVAAGYDLEMEALREALREWLAELPKFLEH